MADGAGAHSMTPGSSLDRCRLEQAAVPSAEPMSTPTQGRTWHAVDTTTQSTFRSNSRPLDLPHSTKSPQMPKADHAPGTDPDAALKSSRVPVPHHNQPLTWQPCGKALNGDDGEASRDDTLGDEEREAKKHAEKPKDWDAPVKHPIASKLPEPKRGGIFGSDLENLGLTAPRFDPGFGPPPPPFGVAHNVFVGEVDYPQADWGEGYNTATKGASCFAKFGGGGSIDVPMISSQMVVNGCDERGYWEVRVDKKIGLMKFGLAHFHEESPGDPGLKMGFNWSDRAGNGCTWYLESSQGDVFEGNVCVVDGPLSHSERQLVAGDIVSIELMDGKASFCVNYMPYASDVPVTRWPVTMCVLFVAKGDQVTLLRNECMTAGQLSNWMETRDERGEKWRVATHAKLLAIQRQSQDANRMRREEERQEARKKEQRLLELERERVEKELEKHDRDREERRKAEIQKLYMAERSGKSTEPCQKRSSGSSQPDALNGAPGGPNVCADVNLQNAIEGHDPVSPYDGYKEYEEDEEEFLDVPAAVPLLQADVEEDDEEDELERVRRERDEARQQLEEARALLLASSCPRAETSADERPAAVVLAPRIGQDQQRDESGDKDYVEFSEPAGEDYDSYALPAEVEEHSNIPEIAGQDVGTRPATAEEDGEYEEGEAEFDEFFDIP